MELCRLTSLPPPHHRHHRARCLAGSSSSPPPQHAEDRISALPDDMLLVVLARLGCASAAARTAILSRRWGRLWTRLAKATFREVQLGALEAALASLGPEARLLDICPAGEDDVASDSVSSVLRAAARLSPVELVFTLPQDMIPVLDDDGEHQHQQLQLPHFHRTTSMELDTPLYMALPPAGEFPALERLCISRWYGVDFADLILRCPRLRVLRARCFGNNVPNISIHSASLEELVLDKFVVVRRQLDNDDDDDGGACHIDIVAPGLKQLTVSFTARTLHYGVSISAPMLHNLSWHCWYSPKDFAVGAFWYVMRLWLTTTTTTTTETPPPAASLGVLANDNSLSMEIYVHRSPMMDAHGNFAREIEKLPVADFTILVLYLKLMDQAHVFGPMVTHLLATNQIRTSTRKLKVVLERWSKVNEACPRDCPCDDEPNNLWTTKTISFPSLEEVEIEGFQGLDDDLDFLKRIFQCAPTLKTMTVKLLDNVTPNDHGRREVDNTFKKYPFVKCYVTSVLVDVARSIVN